MRGPRNILALFLQEHGTMAPLLALLSQIPQLLITGRNEVLAKVIFSQACVILFTGGLGIPACLAGQIRRGVGIPACLASQSPGSLQIFGGSPIFRGGSPIFWGVLQFFGGVVKGGLRGEVKVRGLRGG